MLRSDGSGMGQRFYFSKWLTFSAAAMLQLSAGLGYTFSIYSNDLKEHFGYSQSQIAGIGTACNVGGYFSLFAGLFYDKIKTWNRMGPLLTIWIGAVLQCCGYLGLYAAATGRIVVPYWAMLAIAACACNGQAWYETAGLVTCTRNFEAERGTVIGILKAFLGLSASAYITIYVSFLEPNAIKFLLVLAVAPVSVALVASLFINYVPFIQIEPHTKSHAFHMAFTAVIALAFYQTVIAIARNESQSLGFWTGVLMTAAVAVLIMPILAIPFIFGGLTAKPLALESVTARKGRLPTISSHQGLQEPLMRQASDTDVMPDGKNMDHTPGECLRSVNFWLLWVANGVASGAGLTLLNNLGQQTLALGDGKSSQAVFVSLFSVANCLGRLLSGFIPDKLIKQYAVPRTASLVVLCAMTAVMAFVNSSADLQLLNISSFFTGFAFGGCQGLVPAVTSELFGLNSFATNYAIIMLGPALGSYLMATSLAGRMYEMVLQRKHQHGATCMGPDCFRYTFLIVAALSLVVTLLAIILWLRTRDMYATIIQVMKAERNRRGIKAEIEESRIILDAYVEENRVLVALLARGRGLVQTLQISATDASEPDSPLMQAVKELRGMVREANQLLATSTSLERKYHALPHYATQRLSMSLEEDTSAPGASAGEGSSMVGGATHRLLQRRAASRGSDLQSISTEPSAEGSVLS